MFKSAMKAPIIDHRRNGFDAPRSVVEGWGTNRWSIRKKTLLFVGLIVVARVVVLAAIS
jgi:hypothetical protein